MYVTHHNTVVDHRSRLHVQTSLNDNLKTPAKALEHLLKNLNTNGLGIWMSGKTVFLCKGWDRLLEDGLARAPANTLVTAVPLPVSHAPIQALALLGGKGGYRRVDDLEIPLPQRVRYPIIDRHGRLGSAIALRSVPATSAPLRSPILHPSLMAAPLSVLAQHRQPRSTENNSDLEMTSMYDNNKRFALLPFNMACEPFVPDRSPCRKRSSPELRLGMWVGGSSAERLLGILFRHGTERDFLHHLQRERALFKEPKDTR